MKHETAAVGNLVTPERFHLYSGELSDAPGRNETWDDYVAYLGAGRWELVTVSTDFSGFSNLKPAIERMSTRKIVFWALERDAELRESVLLESRLRGSPQHQADRECEDSDADDGRVLGPYSESLREVACRVGASFCVSRFDKWRLGSWPHVPKVRVLSVRGLIQRPVWIRIYHTVYDVETNLGPAYLYPPNANRISRVALKTEPSMGMGREIKLSKSLVAALQAMPINTQAQARSDA